MLHLHITDSDVILFGLVIEITEYARYANQGTYNEHSHLLGYCGCDDYVAQFGLLRREKLPVWPWRTMRIVHQCDAAVRQYHASALCRRAVRTDMPNANLLRTTVQYSLQLTLHGALQCADMPRGSNVSLGMRL